MIIQIGNAASKENVGTKAYNLSVMKAQGFPVPGGFIIEKSVWPAILAENDAGERVLELLGADMSAKDKSKAILELTETFVMPETLTELIGSAVKSNDRPYAVRSSGTYEDMKELSFAGQYNTFLNVKGRDEITSAVFGCFCSMFSEEVLSYLSNNGLDPLGLEMAVIVQEMVLADVSGVVFTLNPVTGCDSEMVAEFSPGLGEALVSGHTTPETCRYDWFLGEYVYLPQSRLLEKEYMDELMDTAHRIQLYFGFPCDIEFAFERGKLYILQSRPVTRIGYSGLNDIWTTADFKDGGVSATVCTPYMWSLYEYIWEISLKSFLLKSRLLPPSRLRKLGRMFYGRPYWNLSVVKEVMSKLPGFREREFDNEFGIQIQYDGDGSVTKLTPLSLFRMLPIVLAQKRILARREKEKADLKKRLLAAYEKYLADFSRIRSLEKWESDYKVLTEKEYLKSENTYFWQIFLNTVHQPFFRDSIRKHIDDKDYLTIIGGLDNISHLLPFYNMWQITREILSDADSLSYWQSTPPDKIAKDSLTDSRFYLPRYAEYINRFGYHSDKELDVTYPCYIEQPSAVAGAFQETLAMDESCDPSAGISRQKQEYYSLLDKLRLHLKNGRKYEKLERKITKMREMLWWREEFRDISTRFYYLIRIYTAALAEQYMKAGIIKSSDDIWYLKISDIWDFIDKKTNAKTLRRIAGRNKDYYQSYRNYLSKNEIGPDFYADLYKAAKHKDEAAITGIGCGGGKITGTARIINGLSETGCLRKGDILVTRFTDTGWTSKFALLSGIVTEYGGVLCHAAVVSREYGIPCVVGVKNLLSRIADGDTITINGATGEITREVYCKEE